MRRRKTKLFGLGRVTDASEEQLIYWASEGAFGTHEGGQTRRFKCSSPGRVRIAQRLTNDFDINAPGIALALDLLDQIDTLQARIALS
jgi:chaperone modulatory protein CbpM